MFVLKRKEAALANIFWGLHALDMGKGKDGERQREREREREREGERERGGGEERYLPGMLTVTTTLSC
jgi:hypothetical protein